MKKSILITGGCGFVGRHLIDRLKRSDNELWILDDLSTGKHPDLWLAGYESRKNKRHIEYYNGKSKIIFIYENAIDFFRNQIDGKHDVSLPKFSDVFHLASIVGGRQLIDGDPIFVASDLAIDALFFLWATRNKDKIGRILYASSSAAYPIHLQSDETYIALDEDLIKFDEKLGMPDMTYGWSKLTGEYLARIASAKYGMHVACVRPFSGYGPDQDPSYPVPAIAARIAKRENPVEVWGSGKQGRDFVYIDDCVEAMLMVLENIDDGSGINIGTGQLTDFMTVIKILVEIEGYNPEIKPLLGKPVGVSSRYAQVDRINKLGWKPKISLKEGLSRVLRAAKGDVIK